MWQKCKGKYHLLLNYSSDIHDGRFLQTACGDMFQSKKKNQSLFRVHGEGCPICEGVWHIVFTSVDDAKASIKGTMNLKILRRALELNKSVTLAKAIEVRIRKIKKEGAK